MEILDGKIVDYHHQLLEVEAAIQPDPMVAELVEQALAPYRNELAEVIGETATALNRGTTLETTMDNFLLQALLESTGAQLAFSNGWRYGVYFKIKNSSGLRIQKLFAGNEEIQDNKYCPAAFVTMQGVPQKFGRNRINQAEQIITFIKSRSRNTIKDYFLTHFDYANNVIIL